MKNLIVSTQVLNDSAIVTLEGELILIEALKLKPELAALAQSYNEVLIDLNKITKVDLTGLNALLAAKINSKNRSNGISLDVPEGHPIFELLYLTKFTDQFHFVNSTQA